MDWKLLSNPSKQETADFLRRCKKKARFVVDESLGIGVAMVLRDLKFNAVFVSEVGLSGHPDEDVFAFAWREDRILLTHDRDFLDDRRFPPHRNPGLIVLPGADGAAAGLVEALRDVVAIVGPFRDAHWGDKISITEDGIWTISSFDKVRGVHTKTRFKFGSKGSVWIFGESD